MLIPSRRTVLRGGAIAVVAATSHSLTTGPASAGGEGPLGWERAGFERRVGQQFRLSNASGSVRATLVDVTGASDRFSAVFRGTSPLPGGHGIFRLRTRTGHTLDAFVASVDRGAKAPHYQLVVNRRTT